MATELLSVGEVRKILGGRFDFICRDGRCVPLLVKGKRMYDPSLIQMGLERDRAERPGLDDAAEEILERYTATPDDATDDGSGVPDYGDEDNEDAAMSPAVEREMRALLLALRRRLNEGGK